jgi:hypothetical protein
VPAGCSPRSPLKVPSSSRNSPPPPCTWRAKR